MRVAHSYEEVSVDVEDVDSWRSREQELWKSVFRVLRGGGGHLNIYWLFFVRRSVDPYPLEVCFPLSDRQSIGFHVSSVCPHDPTQG